MNIDLIHANRNKCENLKKEFYYLESWLDENCPHTNIEENSATALDSFSKGTYFECPDCGLSFVKIFNKLHRR